MSNILMRTIPKETYYLDPSRTKENSDYQPVTPEEVREISGITLTLGKNTVSAFPPDDIRRMLLCRDDRVGSHVAPPQYPEGPDGVMTVPTPESFQYVMIEAVKGPDGSFVTTFEIRNP